MYYYYCSEPGCTGHIKSWERCSHVRAFSGASSCPSCAIAGRCDDRTAPCGGIAGFTFNSRPLALAMAKTAARPW